MKLDDFLKCKKVRCVEGNYSHGLIRDRVYDVISTEYKEFFGKLFIKIDKNGIGTSYLSDFFEPVLDSAENPLQGVELTPELVAVEPKFKVGDKVYFGVNPKIQTVESVHAYKYNNIKFIGTWGCAHAKQCCHATQENYEMLCKLYPRIEFEQPAKELKGSDLAKALIEKGWVGFNCLCGHSGDENAITDTIVTGINEAGQFTTIDGRLFSNAIPMKEWRPLKAREVGL